MPAVRLTTPNPQAVCSLDVSPDGRTLAVAQQADPATNLALSLWSVDERRHRETLVRAEAAVPVVRFAPGGGLLAYTDAEQRLVLRDLHTGAEDRASFPLPCTRWMSFARERDRLLAGGTRTQVWDARAGSVVWTLPAGPPPEDAGTSPPCCAISPDGTRVAASGVEPGRIVLYDLPGGEVAGRLEGAPDVARSMDWDPSGRVLAAVGEDGRAAAWSLDGGGPVLPALRDPRANHHWCVRFHPDGARVALGLWSGFVQVLRLADGGQEGGGETPDHQGRVWDLAFSRDGRRLFSGGDDGVVLIHDLA